MTSVNTKIMMEWLFGHQMTPDEMLRKNQRALNKAMRDLDRERMKMEQQEKKVIADIKKLAKEGQMVSTYFTNILLINPWCIHGSILKYGTLDNALYLFNCKQKVDREERFISYK